MNEAFTPLRFSHMGRELFGLHLHPRVRARSHAVLLCNPFGQEAIRAHRLYRALGDRLATAGYDVLRFDYFGSGDSAGEDTDFDLMGAISDTAAAADVLIQRSRTSVLSLIGLRLGANVALAASERCAQRPALVAMIEPVISGPRYLTELRDANQRALARTFGARWRIDSRLRAFNLPDTDAEALGFALTPICRSQIAALDLSRISPGCCNRVLVLARELEAIDALLPSRDLAQLPVLDVLASQIDIDWATNSAFNTAIVPTQWITCLQTALESPAHA
ncbi:serine aminopeptidase domain-containing protein [Thiomonas sp. FB-Cd]|uniref:serine aminopeptidase domain-containing protein n=1 Tax=Thiomonas sp. FB-Cd TaxID=1158292 RepID=UPI000A5B4C0D|nr:alpha/beta hydrolase [Thiomonas sp. FB-Cd]